MNRSPAVRMEDVPAISVVVRTIGNSDRLFQALESLSSQTRRDFETVVVDMGGGSNDRVLEEFSARLPRLRVAKIHRSSRPRALNAGIAAASARAIAILDDDNLYDARQLEILLGGLEETGAAYVYCGVRHTTYGSDGRRISCRDVVRPFAFEDVIMGNFIYATGSAFRKGLWEQLGGYDERFEVFEDWDFIIRAAQAAPIVHLPVVAGESRKFTGHDGTSNFDREIESVRTCQAGIYWKHRHLYLAGSRRGVFRATFAEHCARRTPARKGLLARSVRGWRVELFKDLSAWFAHDFRMRILSGVQRSNDMRIGDGA
ncbi:MAG: glycosyltransferase family 2 protein [Thermoanaerobaculia bacterium]